MAISYRSFIFLAAAGALGACEESSAPVPAASLKSFGAQSQIRAAVQGRSARAFEDDLLRLESKIPGLGGIFQDKTGSLVVLLTDMGEESTARQELAREHAVFRANAAIQKRVKEGGIEFRKADYAFSQLVDWQQEAIDAIRDMPGFQSADADESTNRVRIGLVASADRSSSEAELEARGIPPRAVDFELSDRPTALNIRSRFPNGTAGGMGITNSLNATGDPKYCTIGFNVTTNLGESGFLTAGHCDPNFGSGITGEDIYQNLAPYKIGDVLLSPTFSSQSVLADAMFVQRSAGAPAFQPWVAITSYKGTGGNGGSINEVGWQQNVSVGGNEWIGMPIEKVGRTTGWTNGTLTSTCGVVTIGNAGGVYWVNCANRVDGSAVGQGDSGASVFFPDFVSPLGTVYYARGVLIAGNPAIGNYAYYDYGDGTFHCRAPLSCYYLYSPWSAIQTQLGRTFNP